jgi:excisionase family DNA binding protein
MEFADEKADQRPGGLSRAVEQRAFSINEVARIASISRAKVYELVSSGQLPAKKLGTRTLIPSVDLDKFLAELPPGRVR